MCETQHNNADLGYSKTSDLAGDLEDSKSTSCGVLSIFGRRTFVPISWMCKNQTSVSHRSTESEVISLDAGLRVDGLPALDLCDIVIEVLRSTKEKTQPKDTKQTSGGVLCIFWSHTFVPISWMCKKQTSVSHMSEFGLMSGAELL